MNIRGRSPADVAQLLLLQHLDLHRRDLDRLEMTPTTTSRPPSVSAPSPATNQNHTASRSDSQTDSRSAQQPDRTACCARQGRDRGGRASSRSKRRDGSCGKYAEDGALRSAGSPQNAHRSASAPRAPSICCRNCRLHPEAQRRRAVTWPVQRAFEPLQRRSAVFHRPDIVESLKGTTG